MHHVDGSLTRCAKVCGLCPVSNGATLKHVTQGICVFRTDGNTADGRQPG